MKDVLQGLMLFVSMFALATLAEADEIESTLQERFEQLTEVQFLSYESVEQTHADDFGAYRYLVMDFNASLASASVQSNIHSICSTLLKDLDLIRKLSDQGYDMISVSFDRQSQYDCL